MASIEERIQAAWAPIAQRYAAYSLLLPGTPSFICQPEACTAHCCHAFSVALGEGEVERMATSSGLPPRRFLETDEDGLLTVPMAQPYLLRRREGRCTLLGEHLGCTQYEGRPNACRLYPHQVLFIDEHTLRPVHGDIPRMRAALEDSDVALVPMLLRHVECPGFTGPPLDAPGWRRQMEETAALQFPELGLAHT